MALRNIIALLGPLLLVWTSSAVAQIPDSTRATAYYFGAEEAFEQGEYERALSLIDASNRIAGTPSPLAMELRQRILDAITPPQPQPQPESKPSLPTIVQASPEPRTMTETPARAWDRDTAPADRPPPLIPVGAQYSGRCLMFFTVTRFGTTQDIEADCTQPIFVEPARMAVSTRTYTPARLNGRPVERPGVENTLTFALTDERGNMLPFYSGQDE